MAYERDTDGAVRGVGAIAARDAGNRKRSILRIQQARQTQARDRTMSKIAYAPRGGMNRGALGAVDRSVVTDGILPDGESPPLWQPTKLYGGGGGDPVTTRVAPMPTTIKPPILVDQAPAVTHIGIRTAPAMTPPIMRPPTPDTVYATRDPDLAAVSSVAPSPVSVAVAVPTTPAPTSSPDSKRWMMIGAAGLAAYLLLRGK